MLCIRGLMLFWGLALCLLPALCGAKVQPPASPPQPPPEVKQLLDRGRQFEKEYKWSEALGVYEEALTKARALQDKVGEAKAFAYLGIVYSDIGQPDKALQHYEQALPLFRQVEDKRGEANALTGIGNIYSDTGQPDKALSYSIL